MTLAEELEQTGQDAARFRWLAANLTSDLLSDMQSLCGMEDTEIVLALFRQLADERRNTTVAPPGALYDGPLELTKEQLEYGIKTVMDIFRATDPADIVSTGSPLFERFKK